MSNFGFNSLRLVNPWEPSFREARSAVGAADLLANAEMHPSLADAIADCSLVVGTTAGRNRELQHEMHDLPAAATLIRDQLKLTNVALLFGSEKVGLSNHDLSHCHWLLHIPTRDDHVSMNLGQAVAVCLYALRMAFSDASASPARISTQLPTHEELERITELLLQTLNVSDYVKPGTEAAVEEKLRMLIRRLTLTPTDATTLQGMLRQILWKLRSGAE